MKLYVFPGQNAKMIVPAGVEVVQFTPKQVDAARVLAAMPEEDRATLLANLPKPTAKRTAAAPSSATPTVESLTADKPAEEREAA